MDNWNLVFIWLLVILNYMSFPRQNITKLIIKLVFSVGMIIGMLILIYNNFIKEEKFFYLASEEVGKEQLGTKFNLDVLKDETFQGLKGARKVATPTKEDIGRENPFLKF